MSDDLFEDWKKTLKPMGETWTAMTRLRIGTSGERLCTWLQTCGFYKMLG